MHLLAAFAAVGLLAAPAVPGGDGDARIEAGAFTYDVGTGTYRLDGDVVISRGVVRLRARTARWDPATRTVDATGGVLLTDATRAIAAEGIHAVLDGDFTASGVVAFLKDGPVRLEDAATPTQAAACGRNALTATAGKLVGERDGRLRLEQARVSLCDCPDDGAPSWELRADRAVARPGDRVELWWPVLYVTPRFLLVDHPIPVLLVPWISLPLGDRASGLLMTQLSSSESTGPTLAQPLYLTLGRSADLTLTPRYAFGPQGLDGLRRLVGLGRTDVTRKPQVRGPGGDLELRWAPAPGVAGRLELDALWDLADEAAPAAQVAGAHGLRLAVRGVHAQRLDERTTGRLDLDLVGDPLYVRDFTPDILSRDAASRRSALLVGRRGDHATLELSAAWLEPVSRSASLAEVDKALFGADLPAFHRWPSAALSLLPTPLAGPLQVAGRAGVSRFGPPRGTTSDGGTDGVGPGDRGYGAVAPDAGERDGRWQPGERLAATRADARLELSAPFTVGDVASFIPWVRGAALGYAFDAARRPVANGWAVAGLEASTVLARRFGALRNELEPRLAWRAGSGVAGTPLPAFGYDALDRAPGTPPGWVAPAGLSGPLQRLAAAAPPGTYHQARLSLATRTSAEGRELWRAELGQELDLARGRLAEGFMSAAATRGLLSGEADVRFWTAGRIDPAPARLHDSWLDAFSELRLDVTLADPRGDTLHGGLLAIGPGGSGRLMAGQDALFDPRQADLAAQAWGRLGGTVKVGPATLGYQALVPARGQQVAACASDGTREVAAWQVHEHAASFEWDSPCRCFRARATVTVNDCGGVGYRVSVDLGRAAALGAR